MKELITDLEILSKPARPLVFATDKGIEKEESSGVSSPSNLTYPFSLDISILLSSFIVLSPMIPSTGMFTRLSISFATPFKGKGRNVRHTILI